MLCCYLKRFGRSVPNRAIFPRSCVKREILLYKKFILQADMFVIGFEIFYLNCLVLVCLFLLDLFKWIVNHRSIGLHCNYQLQKIS